MRRPAARAGRRIGVAVTLLARLWLLSLGLLALAVGGALAMHLTTTRALLQDQLRLQSAEDARWLAGVLSQPPQDAATIDRQLRWMATTGRYRWIRFVPVDGGASTVQGPASPPGPAPGWFRAWLPIAPQAGTAPVNDGPLAPGRVELVASVEQAGTALWQGGLRVLGWLSVAAVVVALLARAGLRRLLVPLEATVAQALALSAGRYVTAAEPRVPELRRVVSAMNEMVTRLQQQFARQTEQAERWRQQAHADPLTGLAQRTHFIGRLEDLLQREDGAECGALVLVRAAALAEANREHGHARVDRALLALAEVLRTYTDRVSQSLAGRLNGTDFALFVPAAGVAAETAAALSAALRAGAAGHGLTLAIGAVELRRGPPLAHWLARADAALARAELGPPLVPVLSDESTPVAGEQVWREQLLAALLGGRAELAEFPVRAADGGLLHLECALRLRLGPDEPPQAAARWLPLAVRTRLTPRADIEALRLALAATALDGRPRCVNIAAASLADPDFGGRVRATLGPHPEAARRLWLDLPEAAAAERFPAVQALARLLRPLGVRLGLEHAGERLHSLPRLYELGLDYVKLDAAVCTALPGREAAQEFLRHTVQMLGGLGILAIAEGVADDADAQLLLACGLAGITGPWAGAQP